MELAGDVDVAADGVGGSCCQHRVILPTLRSETAKVQAPECRWRHRHALHRQSEAPLSAALAEPQISSFAIAGITADQRPTVGVTGFEPATLRSQSECATKLRYTPSATRGWCATTLAGTATLPMQPGDPAARGRSSMVEPQSSKLVTRVRFPSPALTQPPGPPANGEPGVFSSWRERGSLPPPRPVEPLGDDDARLPLFTLTLEETHTRTVRQVTILL